MTIQHTISKIQEILRGKQARIEELETKLNDSLLRNTRLENDNTRLEKDKESFKRQIGTLNIANINYQKDLATLDKFLEELKKSRATDENFRATTSA